MSDIPERYPNLDAFLGSQFIQDHYDKRSLEQRVADFTATNWPATVSAVPIDIRRFVLEQNNDIESAFEGFNPQVYPPGNGLTTEDWLLEIARLFEVLSGVA